MDADLSRLNVDRLAELAEVTEARVQELVELRIVTPGSDPAKPFTEADLQRVRLIEELEALGVPASVVARAMSDGALSLAYLDNFAGAVGRSSKTYAAISEEIGLPFGLLDQIHSDMGLSHPRPEEYVREDDVRILLGLPILFAAGLDEAEVLRAARVWGEGVRGIAQHQVYSFHELIEEPFREKGLSDDEAMGAAMSEIGARLIPYCFQLVNWLYRRHFEAYAMEHRVGHIQTALEAAGLQPRTTVSPYACVFTDLSGYTQLTEELGDVASAEIALRLARLTQTVANRHDGRVVKMLGDGVHYIFREPANAVIGSLEFVAGTEPLGLPPARAGVSCGPMIYKDGDYYGLAVIIAARLAAVAAAGQVLVSEAVTVNQDVHGVSFDKMGPMPLKGVTQPVVIYRAVPDGQVEVNTPSLSKRLNG
jgi:adenylate cyclase